MIDDLEFFNQATLRICGSLDINEVARECLHYIRQYIPLDGVMMSYYNEKSRSLIFLSIASDIPLNIPKTPISVPEEVRRMVKSVKYQVTIFNNMDEAPVALAVWKSLGVMDKSSIVLFTYLRGQQLGQIDFFVRG